MTAPISLRASSPIYKINKNPSSFSPSLIWTPISSPSTKPTASLINFPPHSPKNAPYKPIITTGLCAKMAECPKRKITPTVNNKPINKKNHKSINKKNPSPTSLISPSPQTHPKSHLPKRSKTKPKTSLKTTVKPSYATLKNTDIKFNSSQIILILSTLHCWRICGKRKNR
jgi:hypothetical protein